jgi:orotate phosphoribosyltransferase
MKERHEEQAVRARPWATEDQFEALAGQLLAQIAVDGSSLTSHGSRGTDAGLSALRLEVAHLVRERGIETRPEPFELASGALSHDYIDGSATLRDSTALETVGRALLALTNDRNVTFDAVGGLTMAADPIAHAVAMLSDRSWFTVRRAAKPHGAGRRVEGRLTKESRVLIVDDVVTTGRSMLDVASVVQELGAHVAFATAMVDRGELAAALFRSRGILYEPICTYNDVGLEPVGS